MLLIHFPPSLEAKHREQQWDHTQTDDGKPILATSALCTLQGEGPGNPLVLLTLFCTHQLISPMVRAGEHQRIHLAQQALH